MKHYSATAVERAMKVHEVIMRAMSGEIAWLPTPSLQVTLPQVSIIPMSHVDTEPDRSP